MADKEPNREAADRLFKAITSQNVNVGDFDTFYSKLSEPDGTARLVAALDKNNIYIGKVDEVNGKLFSGTNPAEKKNEKPATVSPAGGGSSGLLSVKFGGDQYEVNPKTQEVFMGGKPVTVPQNIKDYIAKNMLGVELPKQTGATDSAGVPMGESIQSPIKPTGADIPSTLGDKAAKITEKKMRLGAGGVDEIKVEFTPQQQAKIESFGLNPDQFRNSPLNEDFEKLAKQFDPNINVSDEKAVDKFLDDYRVFSNINAADNLAKQVGVSRKAMSDYMNDLTAEVFIDKPDQKAIYEIDKLFNEAVTKGATPQELDKLKQDRQKAVDFVVNNTNLDVIALRKEIDKKKLDGQDYSAEQKELNSKLSQYNSFVKPAGKVLEQVLKGEPSYNLLDEKFKGKSEKERLRLVYDGMRTELYTIGKKLGFSLEDMKSGKVDIPTYFGFGEDGKRYVELYGKVRDLAPVVLINQSPDEKQDDFLTTFSNSFFGAISPAAAVNTKTEQQTGSDIKTFADLARVQPSDVAAENLNKKLEDYGFGGAFWGQTLGGSLGVGVSIFAGSKGMNLLTGALKVGRFTAPLADFLTTTKGGKAILSGGAYELGGEILPASSGEANFGTGLIGEIATYLPSPVKGLAPALTKLFGDSAEKAAKYIGNAFKRGIAETGQETAQSLYQIYSDTPAGKSVFDNIKQQFGDPSDILKFAISTFIMGAAMGGGADLGLHQSNVDAVNQLSPEDRAIYDSFTGEQRAKANTDILNIAKEQAPLVPTDNLQNQADNTAEAIDKLKNLPLKPIDNPDQSYSVEVDGIKYEGNSQEDLQSDIEYLTELNGIVNNELYNRNSGQTETPTDTEQVQQQPIAEEGVGVGEVSDTANLPQDVQDKIAKLRADEQADLRAAIPNIDEYKVDGEIDKKKIENSPDGAAYKKIYDQYNAPITALFEQGKKEGVTEPTKAPAIKAQVVGTTNGFNTIIDGGLGKQQDPRFTGEVQQGKSIFKVQPNNNESSFLDISLPSYDSFGRQGGIQIRFELPNGVDANTVFEAVKKEAAKVGSLDAKDPNFKQTVQGLVDKGIAEIQGLATGGAKQTAQVKETVSEKQVAEPLKDVESTTKALDLDEKTDVELQTIYDNLQGAKNEDVRILSNMVENVQEKKERNSILNAPLGGIAKIVDGIFKKEEYFLEKKEGREAKEVAEKYQGNVSKDEAKADFKDAFFGNPNSWVADGLKMREAVRVFTENGGTFKELLGSVQKEFQSDGYTEAEAANVIKNKLDALTKKDFRQQQLAEAYHKAKADKSNPDLVKAVEELLAPKETAPTQKVDEGQAKPIGESPQDVTGNIETDKDAAEKTEATDKDVDKVAEATGTKAKNIRDLYDINRKLFGQDRVKSLAAAVAMDRMIGVMAKRAGTTKAEMYARIRFKRATEQELKNKNVLWQGASALANFESWKGSNELLSGAAIQDAKTGEPIVVRVYHGTTNDFYEFDASVKGNIEGHLGKVNYFTSDYQDAANNYQAEGADLTNRIGSRKDSIEQELENKYDDFFADKEKIAKDYGYTGNKLTILGSFSALAEDIAEKELKGKTERVLDVFVKLNNPVVLGNGSTWFETLNVSDSDLDQAAQEIADENDISVEEAKEDYEYDIRERAIENTGYENIAIEALTDALNSNGYDGSKASEILGDNLYETEIDLNKLEKDLRKAELYDNDMGELASSQVIADFFKNLGFDGIILTDVSDRFKNMGIGGSTSHVHVFDDFSNQIKLADGSNTSFGETRDIRFQKNKGNAQGAVMVAMDGNAVIYALTDPNVSTPLHEVAHVFEHYLTDGERATINNWAKTGAWTTETSEKFARGFEKYLSEGIAPTEGLKKVFEKFKTWLTDIYNGIKGSDIDIELNDDMRSIYAKMLGEDAVPAKKAKAAKAAKTKPAIPTETIDKLVGKATDRRAAVEAIADENIKEVAKAVTDTKVIDKVMDAIDNNDQLLADLEKKLGMKKICKVF